MDELDTGIFDYRGLGVLVVDDEETIRVAISMILEEEGFRVRQASTVKQAAGLLNTENFAVAFIDKNLPDGTGLDVVRHIRESGFDTEMSIITAYSSLDSAVEAVHLQVAEYIRKPFEDLGVVVATAARLARLHHLGRENRDLVRRLQIQVDQLQQLAVKDPLTRLYNHVFLQAHLEREIARCNRSQEPFGLVLLHLDGLGQVNANAGFEQGDEFLRLAASVIADNSRGSDTAFDTGAETIAARYGGARFALVLPNTVKNGTVVLAERVRTMLGEYPWSHDAIPPQSVSIGAASYPEDGSSVSTLLEAANAALFSARNAGGGRTVTYAPTMATSIERNQRAGEEAKRLKALDVAIADDRFDMHYQPIVRGNDRTTVAFEALVRPRDREFFPHPGALIQAAEQNGRVLAMGRTLRRLAVTPAASLPEDTHLFINLHPDDLNDPELGTGETHLLDHANRVVLEITEVAGIREMERAKKRMLALREAGFRIAIDDLGAGYSGLSLLSQLDPDYVKLDMGLVRRVTEKKTARLVKHIIDYCNGEGLTLIAEGVETDVELDILAGLGAKLFQGYYFSKPRPWGELGEFLS